MHIYIYIYIYLSFSLSLSLSLSLSFYIYIYIYIYVPYFFTRLFSVAHAHTHLFDTYATHIEARTFPTNRWRGSSNACKRLSIDVPCGGRGPTCFTVSLSHSFSLFYSDRVVRRRCFRSRRSSSQRRLPAATLLRRYRGGKHRSGSEWRTTFTRTYYTRTRRAACSVRALPRERERCT